MPDVEKLKSDAFIEFGTRIKNDVPVEAGWEAFSAGWDAVIEACGGTDHLLSIKSDGTWTLQHPITERLGGTLFDCEWPGQARILVFHERFGEDPEGLWRGFVDESGDRRFERAI